MRHAGLLIAVLLAALALPDAALAAGNLTCQGAVPTGTLYDTRQACSGVLGLQNIFSGLVCDYEAILDAIMTRVYCGVQSTLDQPIRAGMVLFVIMYGLQLIMGYVQANTREVVTRLLKFILIWLFATQSSWGIGVLYNFFTGIASTGMAWTLQAIPMPTSAAVGFCATAGMDDPVAERAAFRFMDFLICNTVTGPFTAQGAALTGFFSIMSYMIPPLFLMFAYFLLKSLAIYIRCLFSYLLCISTIAFMITLSPLFLAFALFRPTYRFFDDWLRYLISFTIQIVLIFAGVSLWMIVISQLGGFFASLGTMVRPMKSIAEAGGTRLPVDTWGLCAYQIVQSQWGPLIQCIDRPNGVGGFVPPAIPPSAVIKQQLFIFYLVINLLAVCTVAYIFDTLMRMIPELARQLAGPAYAPQIGGGQGHGAVNFGKLLSLENVGRDSKELSARFGRMVGRR